MRNASQIVFGVIVIVLGVLVLLANLLDIDFGTLCFPTALILLGLWILIRPWLVGPDVSLQLALFGPVRRQGSWAVSDQEIWIFVGDVRLDFSQADVPSGVTRIRIFGFVLNVRLVVPESVGVAVSSAAFISDTRILGQKRDGIFLPVYATSEGYEDAPQQILVETVSFIADVRAEPPAA
jgi:predicted membrane protein